MEPVSVAMVALAAAGGVYALYRFLLATPSHSDTRDRELKEFVLVPEHVLRDVYEDRDLPQPLPPDGAAQRVELPAHHDSDT